MTPGLDIRPAEVASLAGTLDDDGRPMRWTRSRWRRAAAQVVMGDAFEVRHNGALALVGGFSVIAGPDGGHFQQAWFFAGPAMASGVAGLRAGIEGAQALLDVRAERGGAIHCLVRRDLPKAGRLVRIIGFRAAQGYPLWIGGVPFNVEIWCGGAPRALTQSEYEAAA